MKLKNLFIIYFIVILLIFISGCVDVKQPTVTGSATIKHIKIDYDLDILITNPNDFDFEVGDISIKLDRWNGENIGSGTIMGGSIPKGSSKHFYGTLGFEDNILKAQYDEKVYVVIETMAKGKICFIICSEQEEKIYKKIEINNPIKGKTEVEIMLG